MKNLYIILLTCLFSQTEKILVDLEKVQALRSELPREIIQTLPDGSQVELGRCGFVELGNADRTFTNEEIEEWALNNPQTRDIAIPIAFHVIYASDGTGNLSESEVNDQVDVLNSSYAQWGLSFTLSSLDYIQNSSWFNNDSESQYKSQLAISPSTTLNIYTTTAGGYLGYAYLPQDYNESSYMHGVVLNYQTLPNVYNWEYDEGDTGVHEVGHYLGLYHTFQGSCTGNGDYVDDTPAQDDGDNIYNCWNMDTCTSPGNDPIHNYMNYTDDNCITEFTSGQSDRIAYMVETYKPSLGTQEGCAVGYVDDCSGDGDCCAESWIGDGYEDCEDQAYGCDLTCYNNDGGDCTSAVEGCTDGSACNYNPDATTDNGGCEYPEEHYDCDGNCLVELDCAGNCCVLGEEGCYWQETGPCGEDGPNNGTDSCGVCGGDNSSCADCAGVPCSDAYIDNCGICDDIPENDCVQDCAGTWGGNLEIDECGICGGEGGTAECGCDGIPDGECDCDGNVLDECDVCGGDSSSCEDCAGEPNGDNELDNCGTCDADPSNDCVQDCAGVWGGELEWDCAGICGGDNSSYDGCCGLPPNDDCTDDCYIDSLGACCIEEDADECGVCNGDGTSCLELGDINGDGTINVIDIVMAVDLILSNNYDVVGDINEDGQLNVIDVVMIVDWVLNGMPETTVTDIDGNVYETIQIGDQLWMAENLKVTHYNDGSEISYPSDEDFGSYDEGQYGVYDNDPANADIYGNLYNFAVVDDDRGVCPDGWHVPSDAEYTVLIDYLEGELVAGGKLKECTEGSCPESEYWHGQNIGATNEIGFTGLPAGDRVRTNGTYYSLSTLGYFWSSSEDGSGDAWYRVLHYNSSTVYHNHDDKRFGFSIRCLKD